MIEAVAYDGVDVDMDIVHIAPLARFLRSSHNFKPKPEGLEMTGGIFLPQQVIQIMAHDSATWRVELNNTETEEAVQAYLEALHMCRSKW